MESHMDEIPNDYLCPITQELMENPVIAADGHSYEKTAIESWFNKGKCTSPLTGKQLDNSKLLDNITLRKCINTFKEDSSQKKKMNEKDIKDVNKITIQPEEEQKKDSPSTILFIGNSGVGKSTILNGLLKETKFKSGLSDGHGPTQILQEEKDSFGNSYIDTPGLSYAQMRKQAAAEIEKALKKGGLLKVFFVITLKSGRIIPDDKTTMRLVLEAAQDIERNYSVIINKVTKEELKAIKETEDSYFFLEELNEDLTGTKRVFFNLQVENIKDKDDQIPQLSSELLSFIQRAPSVEIQDQNVQVIKQEQFDKIQEEIIQKHGTLSGEKKENQKILKVFLKQETKEEIKYLEKKYEEKIKNIEKDNIDYVINAIQTESALEMKKSVKSAARSVVVHFTNLTKCQLERDEEKLSHGTWDESPPQIINKKEVVSWASISCGVCTGTEGFARYICKEHNCRITIDWNNPYIGSNSCHTSLSDENYHQIQSRGGKGHNAVIQLYFYEK